MASGKVHDIINLIVGGFLSGVVFISLNSFLGGIFFLLGWLFATFIFGPDTDLMPKKRAGIFRIFLYPYSWIFKHRGASHHILFGTLTRVIYLIVMGGLLVSIINSFFYPELSLANYGKALISFFWNYNLDLPLYKGLTWFYIGVFLADASHVFVDHFSTYLKRSS
ncbi:MAG: hypothetical protein DRQ88_01825 [Epsilonproteobacteria bacterium]|nr:MAG: hypothetical protein DRQ89_08640 [Campylobacterota bacterium]RLA67816.1 MAG: hypothetical protein DRQ88_01825 [Campylobacterota bacterium]